MSTPGSVRVAGPTDAAAARAVDALATAAPELVEGFRAYLPAAADVVNRRVISAAYRERLVGDPDQVSWNGLTAFLPLADGGFVVTGARRHGFDRIEVDEVQPGDPALLVERFAGAVNPARAVGGELTDACVNLALAYARRTRIATDLARRAVADGATDSIDLLAGLDADEQCRQLERLATEGHNLHPCGRTRLGWSVADLLAHDLESPTSDIGFVGVRRDRHIGDDDLGLDHSLVSSTLDPGRYVVTPVHAWQLWLLRDRYAGAVADGLLVPLDQTIPGAPTASLRTLLLPPGLSTGDTRYLKLSLDILVTSTRRSISVASTRNGPVLSRLLRRLLDEDASGDRVLLMAETAGSATRLPGGERDLAAIARDGLSGRLREGEIPVPGTALAAISPVPAPGGGRRSILDELLERYAAGRGLTARAGAPGFLDAYARLLLPPVLRLATRHGIGIEAHLQNCVPTFVDGVPCRLGLRDFAGLRLFRPRLRHPLDLWPGSVIVADSADTMRAKVGYTAVQAHLGELVMQLVRGHDLDEESAWDIVRAVVDEVYDGLRADEDHAFLTAPTVPHKALLTMRLRAAAGQNADVYVPVGNPLR